MNFFRRLRAAFQAFRSPEPMQAAETTTTAPIDLGNATPAQLADYVMAAARAETDNSVHGEVSGTAVQARDIGTVHTGDTHHRGAHHHGAVHYGTGDITHHSPTHYGTGDQITGTVGVQVSHSNSGIINAGGTNTFNGAVIGNNVGVNHGQMVQGGDVHGGIWFGAPTA